MSGTQDLAPAATACLLDHDTLIAMNMPRNRTRNIAQCFDFLGKVPQECAETRWHIADSGFLNKAFAQGHLVAAGSTSRHDGDNILDSSVFASEEQNVYSLTTLAT